MTYHPETGLFVHNYTKKNKIKGRVAGCLNSCGYRQIQVDGKYYMASRLAWFYMNGVWPEHEMDHIDRDCDNNQWSNLRPADRSLNCANRRSWSKKHPRGVHQSSTNRFAAECQINNVRHYIGCFETAEEASKAFEEFKKAHRA